MWFPSPLGVSYFQIEAGFYFYAKTASGFRPLSGYLISKFMLMNITMDFQSRELVSVPSRGILFPNRRSITMEEDYVEKVSVPSRGILFPNNGGRLCGEVKMSFRPLSGYLISKWEDKKSNDAIALIVSVPSRGILFPNHCS